MLFWACSRDRLLPLLLSWFFLAIAFANAQRIQPFARLRRLPLPDEQAALQNAQAPKQALPAYQEWLDEDVRWIITDEERKAFKLLSSDLERDHFIQAFWQRRNPTPDTMENGYKEEHYRRIVFANQQFVSFTPGRETDRGRFYIMYGPPDEIESHRSGGTYAPPFGGQLISDLPYEVWHYRSIKGLGANVVLPFADICRCGDYRFTDGASARNIGVGEPVNLPDVRQPGIKFKDLEEAIPHKVVDVRLLPFTVRTDFIKATDFTVMVPVTLRVRKGDISFANTSGVERGTLNVFGRVTTLAGWVVEIFEDTVQVDVPPKMLSTVMSEAGFYENELLLRPGQYWLEIAVRDVNADRIGISRLGIRVPEYKEGEMATSSLVLSDKMGPASQENAPGTGHFLVATTYVRPLVPSMPGKPVTVSRNQSINVWMQVYDLAVDEKTNKSSAEIEYDVVDVANGKPTIHIVESADRTGGQITLKKTLPATNLHPGAYTLQLKVRDKLLRRVSEQSTSFTIE